MASKNTTSNLKEKYKADFVIANANLATGSVGLENSMPST